MGVKSRSSQDKRLEAAEEFPRALNTRAEGAVPVRLAARGTRALPRSFIQRRSSAIKRLEFGVLNCKPAASTVI
jgi:hypothetical protein